MEFIQLGSPTKLANNADEYCFGKKVKDPRFRRNDLYKFRDIKGSDQNNGTGWYCRDLRKTSFKLTLIF